MATVSLHTDTVCVLRESACIPGYLSTLTKRPWVQSVPELHVQLLKWGCLMVVKVLDHRVKVLDTMGLKCWTAGLKCWTPWG